MGSLLSQELRKAHGSGDGSPVDFFILRDRNRQCDDPNRLMLLHNMDSSACIRWTNSRDRSWLRMLLNSKNGSRLSLRSRSSGHWDGDSDERLRRCSSRQPENAIGALDSGGLLKSESLGLWSLNDCCEDVDVVAVIVDYDCFAVLRAVPGLPALEHGGASFDGLDLATLIAVVPQVLRSMID